MDATPSSPSARRHRPVMVRPMTLVVLALLLVAGTLIQACTDNSGTTGPTFACNESPIEQGARSGNVRALAACTGGTQGPAPVSGNVGAGVAVAVSVNPGVIDIGRRASVIVIVTTKNGVGIPNQTARLAATGGSLDASSGTTDANGVFSTTMIVPCGTTVESGSVIAIVDGVTSPAAAFTPQAAAASNDPCA